MSVQGTTEPVSQTQDPDCEFEELLRRAAELFSTGGSGESSKRGGEVAPRVEVTRGRAQVVSSETGPTLEDFLRREFLPWSEKEHQAHPRAHQRHKDCSKPLLAFFGRRKLQAISLEHVEEFKRSRAQQISPAGVNRELAALRYMLNFALRQGHVLSNPASGVKPLPESPGIMWVVSREQQHRYLAAANPLLRDVATLILETGLRPEEVYSIRKENVHLGSRYLFVPNGKTQFSRRSVPLTTVAVEVLKRRLAEARGPYLFAHRKDPQRCVTTVRHAHQEALRRANIRPTFRLYDLRHTFGSRSAMAGVDLATLKERMGHSHISMTLRYVHSLRQHKRQA